MNWSISRRTLLIAGALGALLILVAVVVLTRGDSGRTELRADQPISPSTSFDVVTTTSIAGLPTTIFHPATTGPPATRTTGPSVDACSPTDPSLILFHRRAPEGPPENVWAVRRNGSCLHPITTSPSPILNWGASASPDGSMIAFVRKDAGVMIVHADGTGERLLLAETDHNQSSAARTQWSPDGKTLVVGRQEGVWTVDVASGKATHLADSGNAIYPSWSPDGAQVVFADFVEGQGYSIDVINADGTGRHTIGHGGNDPYWSSTNQIVYSNGSNLVVLSADGTNVHDVPGSKDLGGPIWSDDGAWIVASFGQGALVVMHPDGSGRAELATGGSDFADAW